MQPSRYVTLYPQSPLWALTACAQGTHKGRFTKAALTAFAELMSALARENLLGHPRCHLGLVPAPPRGTDDPQARYLAGVIFGHDLATGQGRCEQPPLALTGSLAWTPIAPGTYAVFSHTGPHDSLHLAWQDVFAQALPALGEQRNEAMPTLELSRNRADVTPPEQLRTELWVPLAAR